MFFNVTTKVSLPSPNLNKGNSNPAIIGHAHIHTPAICHSMPSSLRTLEKAIMCCCVGAGGEGRRAASTAQGFERNPKGLA